MLDMDPSKRISASSALKHPYFTNEPKACEPHELPKLEGEAHERNVKLKLR